MMKPRAKVSGAGSGAGLPLYGRNGRTAALLLVAFIAALAPRLSFAQAASPRATPPLLAEAYGPYNAVFLPDGPGLKKSLTPPAPLNDWNADVRARLGLNPPVQPDPLLRGQAAWTLAFWFHAAGPAGETNSTGAISAAANSGIMLLAGIGDPSAEDARYIGIANNRLTAWLGKACPAPIPGTASLSPAAWHFAVLASDGTRVTLYADGAAVAQAPLHQGQVAAELLMAPVPIAGISTAHFGGKIAALKIYSEALTAAQVKAAFAAPPDFALPVYQQASPHWGVQTYGQAGLSEPQDPSTLPRGKAPFQKPVAAPVTKAELRDEMVGANPWKLRGGWRLEPAPQVTATGEEISQAGFADKDWLVAVVPGTALTTMIDRGIYPNPDYGLNNMAIPESLAHQDYWYRVEFRLPAEARDQRLTLTFLGVNYAAEAWLNGKKLGEFKGAFLRGRFDVTDLVSESGENALAVRVSPPPHAGIGEEESLTAGPGPNGGVEVLDGPTFSDTEGWDWIPTIRDRDTGIWQDVTLAASGPVEIGDLNVVTTLPRPDNSEADIEIEAPLTNAGDSPVEGELTAAFDNVRVTKRVHLAPGRTVVRLEPAEFPQLKVAHPRLWWPNGYGAPTLHTLRMAFSVNGKTSSTKQIEFGMREVSYELSLLDASGHLRRVQVFPSRTADEALPLIEHTHQAIRQIVDQTPDLPAPGTLLAAHWPPSPGDEPRTWVETLAPGALASPSIHPVTGGWPGTDLVIVVNGVRIAARGGNWGMDDMLKRVSVAHLEPYFRLHRDAHLDIIRNWMGQNTEENFYALADKYGLMVWNDFWDSTEDYNLEAENPQLFLENARDTILRFRHHPSIVVWCGRNEGVPQETINQGLANLVRTLDHTRYYTPSSNRINLRGSGPYLYEPLDTYYRINRGFSVELGVPSIPTLESMKSFIPAPDRWPISDTWAYHDWHQSAGGRVQPFLDAMNAEFGAPTSLADFERKAQMMDYAAHRAIFEGFAAHLWQPNSGRLLWMTQPAWPSTMWNIFSWDYDTQSSYYGVQKACEPVHAQLNLADGSVGLIDLGQDIGQTQAFTVRVRAVTLDGRSLLDHSYPVEAAANARTPVTRLDLDSLAAGHTVFVVLDVTNAAGQPVSNNFYWWAAKDSSWRELDALPEAKLNASGSVATADGERKATVTITNSGATAAVLVKLTLEDAATGKRILPAYYSDNYISLLPGERRTVTIAFAAGKGNAAVGLRGWNVPERTVAMR